MGLENTYFDGGVSPNKYFQITCSQVGRNGSSATYRLTLNARLRYSTSYFNYNMKADININGATKTVDISSGSWGGDGWRGTTVDITAPAGSSGGSLPASVRFYSTQTSYSFSTGSQSVSLSTWNTAPWWMVRDGNINGWKEDKIIPENTGIVTIDAPPLNDNEQSTMVYDIYRYVNGQQDKTIVRGATTTKGNRYKVNDDLSSIGQGAKIQYLIQGHDGVPAWAGDTWTYVYTKNTLTPAMASVSSGILYGTSSFVVNISGASNSDGSTGIKYNLSSPNITIYNAKALSSSPTITIYKSGTAPTTPYINFNDLKNLTVNNNWQGSFSIVVETYNDRGSKASRTITVSIDLRVSPTSATFKASTGLISIGGTSYYLPSHSDMVLNWNAGSDPLGKVVTYDLQVNKGSGKFETIATGLTATSYTYKTGAVTAKTAFIFRLITKSSFNYTVTKDSDIIYAHYYNTPAISYGVPTRSSTEISVQVNTSTRTSMEKVAISKRRYLGKSGAWVEFTASPYTLRETGLTEAQTYSIKIEVTDNSGLAGATQTFTYNVASYVPILSVRKKGVGINAIADDAYTFKVGGNAQISGNIASVGMGVSENSGAGVHSRIVYPKGGAFTTTTSVITGALKIKLPVGWTNTMMSFEVDVFEYSTSRCCKYFIAGYNYDANKAWNNCTAYAIGYQNTDRKNLTVRFGIEGANSCIYIGETSTQWHYPQISISNVKTGFYGGTFTNWVDNWAVGFTATLGTISVTITSPGDSGDLSRTGGGQVNGHVAAHQESGTTYPNNLYQLLAFESKSADGGPAGIGFHRVGKTAIALYHKDQAAKDYIRMKGSNGADYSIYHEGNKPTPQDIGAMTSNVTSSNGGAVSSFTVNIPHQNWKRMRITFAIRNKREWSPVDIKVNGTVRNYWTIGAAAKFEIDIFRHANNQFTMFHTCYNEFRKGNGSASPDSANSVIDAASITSVALACQNTASNYMMDDVVAVTEYIL